MLIDHYLPRFDVTQVAERYVDAPAAKTFAAIRDTDLRDPLINLLFAIRELPQRLLRWWKGERAPAKPAEPITFRAMTEGKTVGGPGWTTLAEQPGVEFVVGSVGRFWRGDYGGRPVTEAEFVPFHEPGYAKLAVGFTVRPSPAGGSILRYEARTATTDDTAQRAFRRYWRLIQPGVAIVMGRALQRIKAQAERN